MAIRPTVSREREQRLTTSCRTTPYKLEGRGSGNRHSAVTERPQDCIEHHVQFPADVFSKEAQYQVSALLQQLILASVAAVRDGIREMLPAVQLHRHTS